MSREDYLRMRNQNDHSFLYFYYKRRGKELGYKILTFEEFVTFFKLWPHNIDAINKVTEELDVEFNITIIRNVKTGDIIKFI